VKASKLEADFALQLTAAKFSFDAEYPFGAIMGRKWRADFRVHQRHDAQPGPLTGENILVEIQGTGPQGRHGSYGHHDSDCEKFSHAAAFGWRLLPLSARMVNDGTGLALVEAALGLREIPKKEKKPRRSKLTAKTKPGKAGKTLPLRVRRAAGLP
jgi:hypothetical protein